jgi:hypothetical protein
MSDGPLMTYDQWCLINDLRWWDAWCDCDCIPIDSDDFRERLEAAGYIRPKTLTKHDVAEKAFASELGWEVGATIWELTAKGREAYALMNSNASAAADSPAGASPQSPQEAP